MDKKLPHLYIITLTDKLNYNKTEYLRNSIYKNKSDNISFIILDTYDNNLGNLSKIFKINEYIHSNNNISHNDLICIVDGHDLIYNNLYNKDQDKLITDFMYSKNDIVISTETKCSYLDTNTKKFFDENQSPFTQKNIYPNSGFIMTYKYIYLEIFDDIIKKIKILNLDNLKSDQFVISKYIAINSKNFIIKLDYENTFCTTVNTEHNQNLFDINSYFIHVTFLKHYKQLEKFECILQHYLN